MNLGALHWRVIADSSKLIALSERVFEVSFLKNVAHKYSSFWEEFDKAANLMKELYSYTYEEFSLSIEHTLPDHSFEHTLGSIDVKFNIRFEKVKTRENESYHLPDYLSNLEHHLLHKDMNHFYKLNAEAIKIFMDMAKTLTEGTETFYRELFKIKDFCNQRFFRLTERMFYFGIDSAILRSDYTWGVRYQVPQMCCLVKKGKLKGKLQYITLDIVGRTAFTQPIDDNFTINAHTNISEDHFTFLPCVRYGKSLREYYEDMYNNYTKNLRRRRPFSGAISDALANQVLGFTYDRDFDDTNPFSTKNSVYSIAKYLIDTNDRKHNLVYAIDQSNMVYLRLAALSTLSVDDINTVYEISENDMKDFIRLYYGKGEQSVRFIQGYNF